MNDREQNLKPVIEKLINKISGILENQAILFEQDEAQEELIESLSKKIHKLESDRQKTNNTTNPNYTSTITNLTDDREKLIDSLLQKFNLIENNLEELNKSLAKGTYPLKLTNAVQITESLVIPKIQAIEISQAQLVETYNEIVNILSGYAINVTMTPDSYRQLDPSQIILEKTNRGSYWIIATLEQKKYKYWLVPNGKIKFNVHKLKTIQTLFRLEGNYNSSEAEFTLQEPAIVSLLPNSSQWRLEKPGILAFGKTAKATKLKPESSSTNDREVLVKIDNQLASTLDELSSTLEQLNSKVSLLEIELEITKASYSRDRQDWQNEKEAWLQKIPEISNPQTIKVNNPSKKVNKNTKPQNQKDNIAQFIKFFRKEKKFIIERIIDKVSISIETLENLMFDRQGEIILDSILHGMYWIIDYSGNNYLIPKDNIKIVHNNLNVLQALFDYQGYYPDYENLQLIRPAIVKKIASGKWQLEEKGKLDFS